MILVQKEKTSCIGDRMIRTRDNIEILEGEETRQFLNVYGLEENLHHIVNQ